MFGAFMEKAMGAIHEACCMSTSCSVILEAMGKQTKQNCAIFQKLSKSNLSLGWIIDI